MNHPVFVCKRAYVCACISLSLVEKVTVVSIVKVKVKVTLVQALRHCTGRTVYRGIRGIALPFHDHGTRRGWGVSVTPRLPFTTGKDPVPIVQEAGWAPGPVWTGAENLAPTGILSLDRRGRSQSLYRLRQTAHCQHWHLCNSKHCTGIRCWECGNNNLGYRILLSQVQIWVLWSGVLYCMLS